MEFEVEREIEEIHIVRSKIRINAESNEDAIVKAKEINEDEWDKISHCEFYNTTNTPVRYYSSKYGVD